MNIHRAYAQSTHPRTATRKEIHRVPTTTELAEAQPRHNHERRGESRATYTVPKVAELMGLSRASVYALLQSGEIPALRMGRRWIIPKRRFHAWFDGEEAGE